MVWHCCEPLECANLAAMSNVLVTGASGGIGAAICKALALRGATVAIHYQSDREGAEATRRAMKGDGHAIFQADLANHAEIERLWQEASARNRIDAIVNNAGIFPSHPPLTTDYAEWTAAWTRTLAINLTGPAHLSYVAARTMAQQNGGRIVNVS